RRLAAPLVALGREVRQRDLRQARAGRGRGGQPPRQGGRHVPRRPHTHPSGGVTGRRTGTRMTPTQDQLGRLRLLVLVDVAVAFTAAALMLLSWLVWVDSPVLPAVTAAVALAGAAMMRALWPLRRGDV